MKHWIPIGLAVMLGVFGLIAQSYKSRLPTPDEERKLAGVTDYIQDGPRFNFTLYSPGDGEVYALTATNNVIVFRSTGGETNVSVEVPNPTNSHRQAFLVNTIGRCIATVTQPQGATFTLTYTNGVITDWASNTNAAFWLFNNNRTAWHIMPIQ